MDFNEYMNNGGQPSGQTKGGGGQSNGQSSQNFSGGQNLFNLINSLAGKFDGKSQKELLEAVYKEAKKNKKAGTLSNAEIDNFVKMISPILDDKKRKYLYKIAEDLKKI